MLEAVRRFTGSLFRGTAGPPRTAPTTRASASPRPKDCAVATTARTAARRPRPILEGELAKVRERLERAEAALQNEKRYARLSGGNTNQSLADTLLRQVERLRRRQARIETELGREAVSTRTSTRRATAVKLHRRPPPTVDAAFNDRHLAQAARAALKRGRFDSISERAVFEKLVADLADGTQELRLAALERLGELKSLAAIPILRAASRHTDDEVRVVALRSVLALRNPQTQEILFSALADSSHRVRVWAVRGLYDLNVRGLVDLLVRQLEDPHPRVRRAAATYLGWLGAVTAERPLLTRLRDNAPEVRTAVAGALAQCGGDASVYRLLGALGDDVDEVRTAAKQALGRLEAMPAEQQLAETTDASGQVASLRKWWRVERVRRLIQTNEEAPIDTQPGGDVAAVGNATAPTAKTDADVAPAQAETDAFADGFELESEPSLSAQEGEGEPDGLLDASPGIGGDFEAEAGLVATDDAEESL